MFTDPGVTGALLRELRAVAGIGLRRMATRTSFTPGYLSQIETGAKPVTVAVVEAYRGVLSDPSLGLAEVDIERLQAAVRDPAAAGTGGVDDISVILERTRHLEDVTSAHMVIGVVRGIDGIARALAARRAARHAAGALSSEVARYRGWLEHAAGYPHTADRNLADAAVLADEAGDASQLAHSLSFRAYTSRHQGNLSRAVDLTESAIEVAGAHPILGVYDSYQRAELLALQGRDSYRAARALHKADRAADATDGIDLPAYGYWYTRGFWGVQRGLVLTAMGRHTDAVREASAGIAELPAAHRNAGWLTGMLADIDPEMTVEG